MVAASPASNEARMREALPSSVVDVMHTMGLPPTEREAPRRNSPWLPRAAVELAAKLVDAHPGP